MARFELPSGSESPLDLTMEPPPGPQPDAPTSARSGVGSSGYLPTIPPSTFFGNVLAPVGRRYTRLLSSIICRASRLTWSVLGHYCLNSAVKETPNQSFNSSASTSSPPISGHLGRDNNHLASWRNRFPPLIPDNATQQLPSDNTPTKFETIKHHHHQSQK